MPVAMANRKSRCAYLQSPPARPPASPPALLLRARPQPPRARPPARAQQRGEKMREPSAPRARSLAPARARHGRRRADARAARLVVPARGGRGKGVRTLERNAEGAVCMSARAAAPRGLARRSRPRPPAHLKDEPANERKGDERREHRAGERHGLCRGGLCDLGRLRRGRVGGGPRMSRVSARRRAWSRGNPPLLAPGARARAPTARSPHAPSPSPRSLSASCPRQGPSGTTRACA